MLGKKRMFRRHTQTKSGDYSLSMINGGRPLQS